MSTAVQITHDTSKRKTDASGYCVVMQAYRDPPTDRLVQVGDMRNHVIEYRGSYADVDAALAAVNGYLADAALECRFHAGLCVVKGKR